MLGVDAISCGIDTTDGVPANQEAMRAAALRGVNLGGHRTRSVQSLSLQPGDLFIAMEPWQAEHLENCYGKEYECTMLGLWEMPQRPYIHDPFGMSAEYFDSCFLFIERSVQNVANKITRKA
jgi:protein-tyrosine phosphatase